MQLSAEQLSRLFIREVKRNKTHIAIAFAVISILILCVGIVWPNRYSSVALIFAEEQSVINPLMEGRAATATNQRDRVSIARELLFGQKIMDQILRETGLINDSTHPVERERIIESLQGSTEISRSGGNLIKIEYRNSDPERAYTIAKRLSELFIEGSVQARQHEAAEAFNFINTQVSEYHKKLTEAEENLKDFRSDNVNITPGNETEVGGRINTLRLRIEQAQLELREAEIKQKTLEDQLSGEAETTSVLTREGQYRTRIAELQQELDTLRLTYHDTYPDIVRIKHQIEDLKEAIANERRRIEAAKNAPRGSAPRVDENVALSPLYQQLRTELSQTKTLIATLRSRINENQSILNQELGRARRMHGAEAALAELTRDYNVNREIYQDLLKRRENARVTMNLGLQEQGPSLRIQEPARMPVKPSGLRFLHFIMGGLVLGIVLPLAVIYAIIMFDPRIRSEAVITENLKLPVLAAIPRLESPEEKQDTQAEYRKILIIGISTMAIYLILSLLKINKVV